MVRQWQQFFYGGRYVSTPIKSPDFVKLADAHGLKGIRVTKRSEVQAAVEAAKAFKETCIIDFRVEQEDSVYPMVPAGADLDKMIRRPMPVAALPSEELPAELEAEAAQHNPIFETGKDK
jgi:acetolactate synthase-1/2/3 large subunit